MTRNELAGVIGSRAGVSDKEAKKAVLAVFETIGDALCEGSRVELRGFGTLRPRYYSGYTGRDPRTGDSVEIPAKVMPVFRPSRVLVQRLNASDEEMQ
jgi:integration host factor subunit beta